MADISISDFRKRCSQLTKRINRTKKSLRITHRGRAIAEVIPLQTVRKRFVLGNMIGTAEIVGDIVSPVIGVDDIADRPTQC